MHVTVCLRIQGNPLFMIPIAEINRPSVTEITDHPNCCGHIRSRMCIYHIAGNHHCIRFQTLYRPKQLPVALIKVIVVKIRQHNKTEAFKSFRYFI